MHAGKPAHGRVSARRLQNYRRSRHSVNYVGRRLCRTTLTYIDYLSRCPFRIRVPPAVVSMAPCRFIGCVIRWVSIPARRNRMTGRPRQNLKSDPFSLWRTPMTGQLTRSAISATGRGPAAVPRKTALATAIGASLMIVSSTSWGDADLEEITVTAQRRTENLQDVPIAVSAFTSADLARAGVRQAGDIAAMVPNLIVASPYGSEAMPV